MQAYHRSDILWRVQLSSWLTTWDRVELELVLFLWISFRLLLGKGGGVPPSLVVV